MYQFKTLIKDLNIILNNSKITLFQTQKEGLNAFSKQYDNQNFKNHNLAHLHGLILEVDSIFKSTPETKHLAGNFFSVYFHVLGLTQFTSNYDALQKLLPPTCFPCRVQLEHMYLEYLAVLKEFSLTTSQKGIYTTLYQYVLPPMCNINDP